jgi:hypothetical protein
LNFGRETRFLTQVKQVEGMGVSVYCLDVVEKWRKKCGKGWSLAELLGHFRQHDLVRAHGMMLPLRNLLLTRGLGMYLL